MIDESWLAGVWIFDDPARSATSFRELLDRGEPADPGDRLEVTTQLARALGLQSRFDEAAILLDSIAADASGAGSVRLDLERGRLFTSSGRPADAVPFFERAATEARAQGLDFLEVDALHMLAIADSPRLEEHARHGIERAASSGDPLTHRWLVSLHNNLGWTFFDAGRLQDALAEFEEAVSWADRIGTDEQRGYAAEALAACREALEAR